jgi:hypothetical protein
MRAPPDPRDGHAAARRALLTEHGQARQRERGTPRGSGSAVTRGDVLPHFLAYARAVGAVLRNQSGRGE